MSPMLSRRSGFALPVAVFAIVIIGALVAGAFFASTQEFRIGTNTIQQTRALGAAEFGLNETHANWNSRLEHDDAARAGANADAGHVGWLGGDGTRDASQRSGFSRRIGGLVGPGAPADGQAARPERPAAQHARGAHRSRRDEDWR